MHQQFNFKATSAFIIFSLFQTTTKAVPAEALTTTTSVDASSSEASSSFDPYGTSSYSSIDPLSGLFSDFDPFTSTADSSVLEGFRHFTEEYASRVSPIDNDFMSAYMTATGIDQIIVLSSYSSALSTAVMDDSSFYDELVYYYSTAGILTSETDSDLVVSQTDDASGSADSADSNASSGFSGSEDVASVSNTASDSQSSNVKASGKESGSASASASDSSKSSSSSGLADSVAPVVSTFGLLSVGFIALLL
ncbi:unnamed protein product [Ambrosiozyma monospora]|uniref:Unnamed protein product n=1 Tax=Ambrosiozyma monospora TaxID=43982 RepID=A0A9W6Z1A5_AMBMO|nr:unnamed protein product [Ambrosiozyma monospora]